MQAAGASERATALAREFNGIEIMPGAEEESCEVQEEEYAGGMSARLVLATSGCGCAMASPVSGAES